MKPGTQKGVHLLTVVSVSRSLDLHETPETPGAYEEMAPDATSGTHSPWLSLRWICISALRDVVTSSQRADQLTVISGVITTDSMI